MYIDGSEYQGEWLNDMKHGLGVFSDTSGDQYDGQWYAGLKHGQGTYSYKSGDKYIGNWKEDKQSGYCCYTNMSNIPLINIALISYINNLHKLILLPLPHQ